MVTAKFACALRVAVVVAVLLFKLVSMIEPGAVTVALSVKVPVALAFKVPLMVSVID